MDSCLLLLAISGRMTKMAKKKASTAATSSGGKSAAKAAKKAKAAAKVERKEAKKVKATKGKGKGNAEDEDDQDLEGILERMRKEWELAHTVTEETADGPPSQRANATLTPCPNGNHLWCIGGEYFSDDGKASSIFTTMSIDIRLTRMNGESLLHLRAQVPDQPTPSSRRQQEEASFSCSAASFPLYTKIRSITIETFGSLTFKLISGIVLRPKSDHMDGQDIE